MSAKNRTDEDRQLAIRASQGDVEAFTKLVRAHSSLAYRLALRMLGNEEAQDASQEIWIRLWKSIRSFRAQSALSTWPYRIALNTCLSARQRGARLKQRGYKVGGGGEPMPYPPEPGGEEELDS